jgi:indolepyruvate ferredoxin oxidoreductase alpha subunit
MNYEVLLGDEAVALGAIHAGLSSAYAYPGTPATEIEEALMRQAGKYGLVARWSSNEKVAFEEALGCSYAGRRAIVSMKHVGLNVAADPFMNSAVTGVNGGLVLAVADDPGMHSSQNEQDSRYFANFAQIFCFEPSNQQEAYDMTREAFDLSEEHNIPVMIRLVTRLAHSRARVAVADKPRPQNDLSGVDGRDWTLLPVNARRRYKILMDRQPDLLRTSEECAFSRMTLKDRKLGIITSGVAFNYVSENLGDLDFEPSLLKVSAYPLPERRFREFFDHVDDVLVVEEGYPFIERAIRGVGGLVKKSIRGKLTGELPVTGELSPELVRTALSLAPLQAKKLEGFPMAARPPVLCQGCSHIDTYKALNEVMEDYPQKVVTSDIGCYTLGALPPFNAIESCVDMGASISMCKGAADAGLFPVVAVIGDSTFGHSGMTPLLDAAIEDTNMTVMILDNSTVAMTGGQESLVTGNLVEIVKGLGVKADRIRMITPLPKQHEENVKVIREEIEHKGLSVIIPTRECIQTARKKRG